jgi:hypothetical protein
MGLLLEAYFIQRHFFKLAPYVYHHIPYPFLTFVGSVLCAQ